MVSKILPLIRFGSKSHNNFRHISLATMSSRFTRQRKKQMHPRTVFSARKSSRPAITYGIPSLCRHFSRSSAWRCVLYNTAISAKLLVLYSVFVSCFSCASSMSIPPMRRLISFAVNMASPISLPAVTRRTGVLSGRLGWITLSIPGFLEITFTALEITWGAER